MTDDTQKSQITTRDQERIDKAVRLGATKQVQAVKFIYEKLGTQGIKEFADTVVQPWAREWAQKIMKRHGLKRGEVNFKDALGLYHEVHDHTAICSDSLEMFFTINHPDLVECGATYCPVAHQWMKIWPEGAHYLCYIYSHSFDEAFFHELNPDLVITKHAEADDSQPGIPHGKPCLMRNETLGKPVNADQYELLANINDIQVSPRVTELLAEREIKYCPPMPAD